MSSNSKSNNTKRKNKTAAPKGGKKQKNAEYANSRRKGRTKTKSGVKSISQALGRFPTLEKVDNELLQVGLIPIAVYNQLLKGWSIVYVDEKSDLVTALESEMTLIQAAKKLPTPEQKQEKVRKNRNVQAYKKLPSELREAVADPAEAGSQSDWWASLDEASQELIKSKQKTNGKN